MMRLTGKQNQLSRAFCIILMDDLTIEGSVIVYSVTFLKGLLDFGLIKQFSDSELTIEELHKRHKASVLHEDSLKALCLTVRRRHILDDAIAAVQG